MKIILTLFLIVFAYINSFAQKDGFWEIVNGPESGFGFAMAVNSVGDLFVSSSDGIYKSSDNGNTWTHLGLTGMTIYSIDINELDQLLVGVNSTPYTIYKSIDSGQTWYGVWDGLENAIEIKSYPGGLVFASSGTGSYTSAIRSTDYGETWQEVITFSSNTEYPYGFAFKNSDTIFMATINWIGDGGVYMFTNGGDNWEHIGLTDHYVSSVGINSNGDLFAGVRGHYNYEGRGVYLLENNSSEWQNIEDIHLVTSVAINSENYIYIGCSTLDTNSGGVWYSDNNGLTWEDISDTTMYDKDIERLTIDSEGYLYALAYQTSQPLYKSKYPTIGVKNVDPIKNELYISSCPNPFSRETAISFRVPYKEPVNVQLTILDLYGKKIKEYYFEGYRGEEKTITFDASNLPAGLYICHMNAGGMLTSHKLILNK